MFSRIDLDNLLAHEADPAVTLLLSTHGAGPEIRQDALRLRTLTEEAAERLASGGMRCAALRRLLEPARRLLADEGIWRNPEGGLAVFLAPDFFKHFNVPVALPEEVVIGRRFHVKHLLLALPPEDRFLVLALSARHARLFEATASGMSERRDYALPVTAADVMEDADGGGDGQAVPEPGHPEYLHQVASALERYAGGAHPPIVLAALPEMQGSFRAIADMPNLLEEGLSENPDGLDEAELHKRAGAIVAPLFANGSRQAEDRFHSLLGKGSSLATTRVEDIVKGARDGRVETLFVAVDDHVWGRVDDQRVVAHGSPIDGDEDLLDYAAAHTILKGGQVNAVSRRRVPRSSSMAAIFRY